MSKRTLGILPKSGEKILKDAIGQFKGIIAQIEIGIKKVKSKVEANEKKLTKIQEENVRLVAAVDEAINAQENLEALLSGKIMTLPTEDEVVEEAVETDETEDTTSE